MRPFPELEVLKEVPGYKAVLKAILRSQIQLLVQQLSDEIGEESVLITASLTDGTLTHLGSHMGQVFIEGHDEVRSQFLGFCLKRHHKIQEQEQAEAKGYHGNKISNIPNAPSHPALHPPSPHDVTTVQRLQANTPPSQQRGKMSSHPTHRITSHPYKYTKTSKPQTASSVRPMSMSRVASPGSQTTSSRVAPVPGINQSARQDDTQASIEQTHLQASDTSEQPTEDNSFRIEENSDFVRKAATNDTNEQILPLKMEVSFAAGDEALPSTLSTVSDTDNQYTADTEHSVQTVKVEPVTDGELESQLFGTPGIETSMPDSLSNSESGWPMEGGSGMNYAAETMGASGVDDPGDGSFDAGDQSMPGYNDDICHMDETLIGSDQIQTGDSLYGSTNPENKRKQLLWIRKLLQESGTSDGHYKCSWCGKSFAHYRSLRRHIYFHLGKRYLCGTCHKFYKDASSFARHLKNYGHNK